jgi:serine/threonine-protein kinase
MSSPGPATIGRYVVEAEIGRGAMGVVYRARDPRIGREVALKTLLIHPGMDAAAAQELKERFLNEGRAAGRLHHPGIVSVFDADEDPATGIAYLAMEFVQGRELRSFMPAMPARELVGIIAQVADALDHAHERGVVHRDVKPANILVDGKGRAKLTDFGIARLGDSNMTHAGQVLGSPAYMSPEQVRSMPVTAASDIFSLGVVLYEGLTARKPFSGNDMVATTHAIANEQPERPSHIAPGLGRAIDAVLERALAKRPEDRYATASGLASAAVAAVGKLRGTVVAGRPITEPALARPRAWNSGLVIGAAVALALLAIGAGFFARGRGGATPNAVAAIPPGKAPAVLAVATAPPVMAPTALAELPATTAPRATTAPLAPAPRRSTAPPAREPAAPAPAPIEAARVATSRAALSRLDVELHTFHEGTLVVLAGEREIGRRGVYNVTSGGFKLKNPKFGFRAEFPIAAGRYTLTFRFIKKGDKELSQRAVQDVPADRPLLAKVDIGTLGREMDLRFE